MAQENDNIVDLINRDLLDALFDEWMRTDFHTIRAKGTVIQVIDKNGARTVTRDLTGPSGPKGDKGDRGPQGVKGDTGYEIHLEDMTPAEQQELKDLLADGLVFASDDTCREIVDELD